MTAEFVDTNVLIYAHDPESGPRQTLALELIERLYETSNGAISVQVLQEFYSAGTKKLHMTSYEAASVIEDLASWTIHRPSHADILHAIALQRRHKISWWDALIINSALQLGCAVLWSEDLSNNRKYGPLTVRNPFA